MNCFVPAEDSFVEPRTALTPESAAGLVKLGLSVHVEPGLGRLSHYPDAAYVEAHLGALSRSTDLSRYVL